MQATGLRLPIEIIGLIIDWCLIRQFIAFEKKGLCSWPNYIHDAIGLALVHPEIARSMKRRVKCHARFVYLNASIYTVSRTDGT